MHKRIDNKRDKSEPRRKMHKLVDNKRNKNPKRKLQLASYEKTDKRRRYVYDRNNANYRNSLVKEFKITTNSMKWKIQETSLKEKI